VKPHPFLIVLAALIAASSLALGGWQLAKSFSPEANALDLAAPIVAVATALICITMLDWARNLPRRGHAAGRAEDDDEGAGAAPRPEAHPQAAGQKLMDAILRLERIGDGAPGGDATLQEATALVAGLAEGSAVTVWLADDSGALRLRAAWAEGAVTLHDGGTVGDEGDRSELQELLESRRPLEAKTEEAGRFLFPLVNGERCFGALRVAVPAAGWGEGDDAFQRLGAGLARVAGAFARALGGAQAYEQAVLDRLTGVYTRRHLVARLGEAASVCRRYGEPLSLVLLDMDQFGMLNETFGLAAGDRLLGAVASLIRQNVRDADSVYRSGPDEFAVLLPNTELDKARSMAERLRRIVRESRTPADDGNAMIVTLSGGVVEFDEDMRGVEPLLERAAEALTAARTGGRDRIQIWAAPTQAPDKAASNK
jgi:diguanylate cyclase (GGDEF)-like protein